MIYQKNKRGSDLRANNLSSKERKPIILQKTIEEATCARMIFIQKNKRLIFIQKYKSRLSQKDKRLILHQKNKRLSYIKRIRD